jgi:hypothetical protein
LLLALGLLMCASSITNVALLLIPIDPWHLMVRTAVSHARDPHGVGAATAEFANIELASVAEILRSPMQRDVLRAGVWIAEYVDEEERWVLVERLQQLKLQAAIALADALRRSGLVRHKLQARKTWLASSAISVAVAHNVLTYLAFPVPFYLGLLYHRSCVLSI